MLKNQCDRCGDYYNTEYNHRIAINVTQSVQYFDLCKKCNSELITWLTRCKDFKGANNNG